MLSDTEISRCSLWLTASFLDVRQHQLTLCHGRKAQNGGPRTKEGAQEGGYGDKAVV
jgi:hypothetical protein